MKIDFDNSYARLPERFYSRVEPEPVSAPETLRVNTPLARRLGFDPKWLASPQGAAFVVGNHIIEGAEPIALAYAGHQFGGWVPRLGDGRAILLGEVLDEDGQRFDLQLKGSGRTPYSRRGDGRAPIGPVLREYLVSEAMARLGVATTRTLAIASTGESVWRQQVEPGGVLVRVARSHVRVGTFQYFAARDDREALTLLTEHVLDRHFPDLEERTPMGLLEAVCERQASLIASWQLVGFIHGVMNTDNMLVSGETIDYGPCAFMNEYAPETVYSSIDQRGRYAYGNQPFIAQWNLTRLAESLLLITGDEDTARAQEILDAFPARFRALYGEGMARKLGLAQAREEDWPLFEDLLELMYTHALDYTLTFRHLTALASPKGADAPDAPPFELPAAFDAWLARWRARLEEDARSPQARHQAMRAENPVFIPRNHLVNRAIDRAVERGDLSEFHALVDLLAAPFDYDPEREAFARPPAPEERIQATFCGT